jgi:O-antigen/teichoic acid export membrane protein
LQTESGRRERTTAKVGVGVTKRSLKSVFASVAWLSASSYLTSVLALVRGVLFARILGPQSYGVWAFLSMVQSLSLNADLGVMQVVSRDMPRMIGRGDEGGANSLAWLTRFWTPLSCGVAGIVLGGLWQFARWPAEGGWSVLAPLLIVAMSSFTSAQVVEKGSLAFARLSVLTTAASALGLVAGVAASAQYGARGLVVSQSLVYGGAALVAVFTRRESRPAGGLWIELKRAIRAGWSLLLPSLALSFFVSLDVIVVAWRLTTQDVGQYSVALLGSSMAAGVIAGSVGTVVGQHLLKETAGSDSGVPEAVMVWGPAAALAAILAPACAIAALLVSPVLRVVLPSYSLAVPSAVVLLSAAYYLQSQFGFSTTFVSAGKPLATLPLFVVLGIANVAIDVALIRAGLGLLAVAVGSLIVNVVFVVAHEILVASMIGGGRRQLVQGVATVVAGGLPLGAALSVLGHQDLGIWVAVWGLAGWAVLVVLTTRWFGVGPLGTRSIKAVD